MLFLLRYKGCYFLGKVYLPSTRMHEIIASQGIDKKLDDVPDFLSQLSL
jgi:hypothetical protein